MKGKYTVIPASHVDRQLIQHVQFISRVSIKAARHFRDEFEKVVDKLEENPLELPEKNQLDYMCGISDDELTRRFKESIRIDDEIRKVQGLPVARYDTESKRAYLLYPDGKIEYV